MKKNKYSIMIGIIFLGLFFLSRQPFLARAMSNEEKLALAVQQCFESKGLCVDGELDIKIEGLSLLEIFKVNMSGCRSEEKKKLTIRINSQVSVEDCIEFNYYEDYKIKCIMTPFKQAEKLVMYKREDNNQVKAGIIGILGKAKRLEVQKDIPIDINQKGLYKVNILSDCYTLVVDTEELKVFSKEGFIQEAIASLDQIKIKIYIDESLKIRRITINQRVKDMELEMKLNFHGCDRLNKIEKPSIEDGKILKGTMEELILELIGDR